MPADMSTRRLQRMTDRELEAILDTDADEIVLVKVRIELDRRAAARPKNLRTPPPAR